MPPVYDFSPAFANINRAIDRIGEANEQNWLRAKRQTIGDLALAGKYKEAAAEAMGVDLGTGINLLKYGTQQQNLDNWNKQADGIPLSLPGPGGGLADSGLRLSGLGGAGAPQESSGRTIGDLGGGSRLPSMLASDPKAPGYSGVQKAFLDAVAAPESGGRYDVRYTPNGGATFALNGRHPNIPEAGPEGPSTAAGRYQFTNSTWRDITGGNVPFTPENQDRYAIRLATRDYAARTGRNLWADLQQEGFSDRIRQALTPTWAGLRNGSKVASAWQQSMGGSTGGRGATNPLPSPADAASAEPSTVAFRNPDGTVEQMQVDTSGAGMVGGVRVAAPADAPLPPARPASLGGVQVAAGDNFVPQMPASTQDPNQPPAWSVQGRQQQPMQAAQALPQAPIVDGSRAATNEMYRQAADRIFRAILTAPEGVPPARIQALTKKYEEYAGYPAKQLEYELNQYKLQEARSKAQQAPYDLRSAAAGAGLKERELGQPTDADQRLYERAQQQGYQGTILDFKKELAAAGRPTINNNIDKGETEEMKALGKGRGERAVTMETAAAAAPEQLAKINLLGDLLARGSTGALGPAHANVVGFAQALGVPDDRIRALGLNPEQAVTAEAATKIINELVVGSIGKGGFPANNFSDADRIFLTKIWPSISNRPDSNAIALEVMRRVEQRKMEIGDAWMQYQDAQREAGKPVSVADFEFQQRKAAKGRDMFRDLIPQAVQVLRSKNPATQWPAQQQGAAAAVPSAAVQALRQRPELRDQFDAKYGPGAAARVLGGQ